MAPEQTPRRPGGRSARVRAAVHDASLKLLQDKPIDEFTINEVAAISGVHETSIYRRWGTRERLMADALIASSQELLPVPNTGSLRDDLAILAGELAAYLRSPLGNALAHALASPSADPALDEARTAYLQLRIDTAGDVVRHAVARGELPETTDAALIIELLVSPLHFRTLMSRQPITDDLPTQLVELVVNALR